MMIIINSNFVSWYPRYALLRWMLMFASAVFDLACMLMLSKKIRVHACPNTFCAFMMLKRFV